jgi:hypothetical protein
MDQFFDLAIEYDMNITLDFHRVSENHQSYSPISEVTFEEFMDTWYVVLDRYQDHPKLYAVSIFNEYQGENVEFWNSILKSMLMEMELRYPERFHYIATCVLWSGNCHDVDVEDLTFSDRILYGWHKYRFSSDKPYEDDWEYSVGRYPEKIVLEEWGFKMTPEDIQWANRFIQWLKKKHISNNFFWTLAYSGDTDGLFLDSDCKTINWEKYNIIKQYCGMK